MQGVVNFFQNVISRTHFAPKKSCCVFKSAEEFDEIFLQNLKHTRWEPHPQFNVFTQYDQSVYLRQEPEFRFKYRSFNALTLTLQPGFIIELGPSAGASADAYLCGSPNARYLGIDLFGSQIHESTGELWDPLKIGKALLRDRGFKNFKFVKSNLRYFRSLPRNADLVVVDGAHDYFNQLEDIRLAMTSSPTYIFIDDAVGEETREAINRVLNEELKGKVLFTSKISYIGEGFLIALNN